MRNHIKLVLTLLIISVSAWAEGGKQFSPLSLTLKPRLTIEANQNLLLQDVVVENVETPLASLVVIKNIAAATKVLPSDVVKLLEANLDSQVSILGDYCVVYIKKDDNTMTLPAKEMGAIAELKSYLQSYLDPNLFDLELKVIDTKPPVDISRLAKGVRWQLPVVDDVLSDIDRFRRLTIINENNRVLVSLDIKLHSYIYQSKVKQKKDDLLKVNNFTRSRCDITMLKDRESLVFDIDKVSGSLLKKSIGVGAFLRADSLSKIPDVIKGDSVVVKMKRSGMKLELTSKALSSSRIGKRITVITSTKKRVSGILRKQNEQLYVEVD